MKCIIFFNCHNTKVRMKKRKRKWKDKNNKNNNSSNNNMSSDSNVHKDDYLILFLWIDKTDKNNFLFNTYSMKLIVRQLNND